MSFDRRGSFSAALASGVTVNEPRVVSVGECHRMHRVELAHLGEQVEGASRSYEPHAVRPLDRCYAFTPDGTGVAAVMPSRRRTMVLAMSRAAGSSRRTKLVLAARMMPFSSNVSASGSSSAGSSCCSSAVTTNWRMSAGESALKRGDLFLDRSRSGAHLQDGAGEEAAARECAPHEVVEERVAHGDELRESGRGGECRLDDLGLEDPCRLVHGGELEILLRAEVGVDAALAHVERAGEVADREALEPVDRRERHRFAHDRGPGALAIRSLLSSKPP